MLNFYFIRHAESTANVDSYLIGGRNINITEKGRYQAHCLGKSCSDKGIKCDVAISSTAVRTQETAQIVLSMLSYDEPIKLYDELLEFNA